MTKTEHISARSSRATKQKLVELMELYGSQAEVLAIAIDHLHREEITEPRRRAAEQKEREITEVAE